MPGSRFLSSWNVQGKLHGGKMEKNMNEETTTNEATDIGNREPSHVSLTGLLGGGSVAVSEWISIEDALPGLNWPCMCKLFYRDIQLPGRLIQLGVDEIAWVGEENIVIAGVSHWRYVNKAKVASPIDWKDFFSQPTEEIKTLLDRQTST